MPKITSFWLDDDIIENKEFKKITTQRGSLRKIINELLRQHFYKIGDTEEQLHYKINLKKQELEELETHLLQLQNKQLPMSKEINDVHNSKPI